MPAKPPSARTPTPPASSTNRDELPLEPVSATRRTSSGGDCALELCVVPAEPGEPAEPRAELFGCRRLGVAPDAGGDESELGGLMPAPKSFSPEPSDAPPPPVPPPVPRAWLTGSAYSFAAGEPGSTCTPGLSAGASCASSPEQLVAISASATTADTRAERMSSR